MGITDGRRRVLLVCGAVVLVYLASYAMVRVGGVMVHVESRGNPHRAHEVKVPDDPWIELLSTMAEDSDSTAARAHAAAMTRRGPVLNVIFYPLRGIETFWWRMNDGTVPGT